jgi:hypothetical protein
MSLQRFSYDEPFTTFRKENPMRFLFSPGGILAISIALLCVGCTPEEPSAPETSESTQTFLSVQKAGAGATESTPSPASVKMLDGLNVRLAADGKKFRVAVMEYITAPSSGDFGTTVFAKNVGNKQLAYHYAPALLAYPGQFTYIVDELEGAATGGLTNSDTEPAIDRAMTTWDNADCSTLPILKVPYSNSLGDLGVVQFLLGFGGSGNYFADLTHAGWLPGAFFDAIAPGGSASILGVTFTFYWIDAAGNPVDTNGDHKYDAAFREIYYNNVFPWTTQVVDYTSPLIDVESVALHESGHGLSQAHFGQIFHDGKGTKEPGFQVEHLHFSPRAVMNAIYWDTQRSLLSSDLGGHCSIWGNWPSR